MNIKRAGEEIKNTVRAYLELDEDGKSLIPIARQRPILLIGPPGIGKTDIVKQVAASLDIPILSYTMTHHTRQSVMGLPYIDKDQFQGQEFQITSYTMSEIIASVYKMMKETGREHGILFIDEINCVSETLAPVMLQFLQEKKFGNTKLPEGWIIVAAGNPQEYNRAVREFDVATLDRVRLINVEPDYKTWKEYAGKAGIHRSIQTYLGQKEENFYKIETTVDGKRFVTARGWEDLSNILKAYERLGIGLDESIVEEYIQHSETAIDFANYLELYAKYEKMIDMQQVLEAKLGQETIAKVAEASFDEKISIVSLLLGTLDIDFRSYYLKDKATGLVFEDIKSLKKNSLSSLSDAIKIREDQLLKKRKGGMIDRDDELIYDELIAMLKELNDMALDQSDDEAAMKSIEEGFYFMSDEVEAAIEKLNRELENAYDFADQAFGLGPEMVLFITELSAGFYSLYYLKDNGSERFYKYNSIMLKDSGREDCINSIDQKLASMI